MNKLLTLIQQGLTLLKPKSKPTTSTIESYGQTTCGVPLPEIQCVMEWLFASLLNAGYEGRTHIIWYNDAAPNTYLKDAVKEGIPGNELIFLYRCGNKVQTPPDGYYWRLMPSYTSLRIYQLEVKKDD